MKARAMAIAALTTLWASTAQAQDQDQPGLSLGVTAGARLGNTTFGLKFSEFFADAGGDVTGESALNWPADFLMLGVRARWATGGAYTLTLDVSTNVHDPLGTMDDSDWIAVPSQGVPRTKFAYTESTTRGRAIVADIGLRAVRNSRWQLVGGYRHEYYRGDAWGADGWFDDGSGRLEIAIDDSVHGIHFESHRFMPYLGARFRDLYEGRMFGVYTDDYDDHVLRYKEGTGRSLGIGLLFAAQPRWQTGARTVGVDIEMQLVRARWGTLEQHFYADDPGTADNELATTIPDSDYLASSVLLSAMFVAEIGM